MVEALPGSGWPMHVKQHSPKKNAGSQPLFSSIIKIDSTHFLWQSVSSALGLTTVYQPIPSLELNVSGAQADCAGSMLPSQSRQTCGSISLSLSSYIYIPDFMQGNIQTKKQTGKKLLFLNPPAKDPTRYIQKAFTHHHRIHPPVVFV